MDPAIRKHSFFCPPPQVAQCVTDPALPFDPQIPGSNTVCQCVPAAPTRLCTASIVYPQGDAAQAQLVPMEAHCDVDGAIIALAIIIARLAATP